MINEDIPTINFDFMVFEKIMISLEKQSIYDTKCTKHIQEVFNDNFITGYNNTILVNQLLTIVKDVFNDNNKDSWIEYYIYELEFGKKYKDGCASYNNGEKIDISNLTNLYNFLIKNLYE